ncbi:MAG: pyruvate kinase alpha/beta domain-containing protein, partial [Emticicia sp.]
AESASGKYPILAVETMVNTIVKVEELADEKKLYFRHHTRVTEDDYVSKEKENDNVVMTACRLARDLKVKAIIGITNSGYTAVRLSHHRPKAGLFIFTHNETLATQLSLYSGVQAFVVDTMKGKNVEQVVDTIRDFLIEKGELEKGDLFINTLSLPLQDNNRTNTVKLSRVK